MKSTDFTCNKPRLAALFALVGCLMACRGAFAANIDVPFLSQAPLGQWRDLRQGQGCEEAVSLMAVAWARGQASIDRHWGRGQVVAMSNWEKEKFGYYVDTSIQDTAQRLMAGYLGFKDFKVVKNISVKNVAAEVYDMGHPVIVGIDGRKIGKPYYVHGGPRHHVLLITGYDKTTDVFTFHDPGKSLGQNRTLSGPVLQSALADYPSGNGSARTYLPPAMIVVYATTAR